MTLTADLAASFDAEGAETFTIESELTVETGETLVILGPSGSGKSLLLETIAGFHPHEGTVENNEHDLTEIPPERREFGFVFQDYALFPHMTVKENVAFGARYHEATRDPETMLAELGVSHLAERTPKTLSGGESQRVALARSLAIQPDVLLLDEPLSALDVPTRQALREDLAGVLEDVTAIHVTHNRTTARALADRIAVMREGRIVQTGTPEDVFERPVSPFVARFTGANCLSLSAFPGFDGAASNVAIRPEHVVFDPETPDATARVTRVTREDASSRVSLALEGTDETLDAFSVRPPAVGDTVEIGLPRERTTVFGEASSESGDRAVRSPLE
ncbi:MAG TPA: ATP-binding cassette domain-containing protein [Halococcus sp.]|nr:ATP-binding cassette domain-containing protein [Halococcus sp.]